MIDPEIDPWRLACGGAVHPGREGRHHPPLWRKYAEPLAVAIATAIAGGLIGFSLFLAG